MAINWGAWKYGGGNGMRVGMEVTWSAVNSGSASVTATVDFWTQNQYSYSDAQSLNISNNLGSNHSYTNNSGTTAVKRTTRTYTYNYSTWGSSPGSVTFGAVVEGTYNNISPSVSVAYTIPARPGGPPTVNTATATAGIRSASISWTASGDPGISSYSVYRNNDGNQLIYSGGATSTTDTGRGNGESLFYIVYAFNAAGNGSRLTGTVTTPSLPSTPGSLTANAATFGRVSLSWTASSGSGYTVTYTVRRGTTVLGTTTSTSYTDTTVEPSTAYTYTVTPGTDVGSGTAASVSTTSLGGIARIYNGSSYVTTLPKIWNGATWVDGQARIWNGTEWKYGS
jgi:hypothetical protein